LPVQCRSEFFNDIGELIDIEENFVRHGAAILYALALGYFRTIFPWFFRFPEGSVSSVDDERRVATDENRLGARRYINDLRISKSELCRRRHSFLPFVSFSHELKIFQFMTQKSLKNSTKQIRGVELGRDFCFAPTVRK